MQKKQSIFFSVLLLGCFFIGLHAVSAATTTATSTMVVTADVAEWSTSTATTTPPPVSGGGGLVTGDATPPSMIDFRILEVTKSTVKVSWRTDEPVVCQFDYGVSAGNLDKSINSDGLSASCLFDIRGLEPDTKYFFRAISTDSANNQTTTENYFRTSMNSLPSGLPMVPPVENVKNLAVTAKSGYLQLSWDPLDRKDDFKMIILRSNDFFPTDEHDGTVLYLGPQPAQTGGKVIFQDKAGIDAGVVYYYTVLTVDENGHRSSGALAFGSLGGNQAETGEHGSLPAVPGRSQPLPGLKPLPNSDDGEGRDEPALADFTLTDIDFLVNDRLLPEPMDSIITMPADNILTVMIAKIKLRNKVEDIAVSIDVGGGSQQIVSLTNRLENRYFVGNLGPIRPGIHRAHFVLYDADHKMIKEFDARIVAIASSIISGESLSSSVSSEMNYKYLIILLSLLILVLILRRRREGAQKK